MPRMRPVQVVSMLDSAVELSDANIIPYANDRDISKLRFDRSKAVIYTIRQIPDELMDWVEGADADSDSVRSERAFRAAVVRIDNLPNHHGEDARTWEPERINDLIAPEDCKRVGKTSRREIGWVAYTASFLDPWIEPVYALPPTLWRLLASQVSRRVAANQAHAQAKSNDERSSSAGSENRLSSMTASETRDGGSNSGSPTVAPAEDHEQSKADSIHR